MKGGSLIETINIQVFFGDTVILTDVSMSLNEGRLVTLIGPNGAGKTTLVNVLLGFLKPQSGTIIHRKGVRIGYMPQKIHIDPTLPLSVQRFLRLSQSKNILSVEEALDKVKAHSLLSKPMQGLSGGELQRVLLAKAIMKRPHLLILDEPVQGVDLPGQAELYSLIEDIKHQFQCGILLISHDLHLVLVTSDHVICLNKHICCSGSPHKVTSDPRYRALFGEIQVPQSLAPYAHEHDHTHDASPDFERINA